MDMGPVSRFLQLDQLHSSYFILVTLATLALLAGALYYVGLLGRLIQALGLLVRGAIRQGFRVWERLLAWAEWPLFLAMILGLLGVGSAAGRAVPGLAILCGLLPLVMGIAACLAYMFIDLERYEVERGYKAMHDPMKGQELAHHLLRYGQQVSVLLLAVAALGVIGGFAMLNWGLARTVGGRWYRLEEEPAYADFVAYALVHIYSVVDLLDLANSRHLLRVGVVKPAGWPTSTLLILFKTFLTLVLLQQIFASVRKGKLLSEMIADFWSPHEPIHQRARMALPQYGAAAIGPLLASLRSVANLTKEQRDQLPLVMAMMGPSSIPSLVGHLRDPHEHVRAVVAAALGHLHALNAVPLLASLVHDPSDMVRLSVVEALGLMGDASASAKRKRRRLFRPLAQGRRWWWRKAGTPGAPSDPTPLSVHALRRALGDISGAVRSQAASALGRVGTPAAAVAPALIGLLKDSDETVRCQAAQALACVGGGTEETVDALVELLQDTSVSVKASAARALGALRTRAAPAVPALIPLLHDRDELVRTAAADAVAQAGPLDPQATEALAEGLASPDTVVQAQTAEALAAIGTVAQEAAPALVEALENGSDRVRAKAADALGKIGEAAADIAVPSLMRALHDKDNWVSAMAAEALGEMGESADAAVPALIRSLQHSNPLVRSNAAEALAKMGPAADGARSALEKAARDADGGVRSQAIRALGTMGRRTMSTEPLVLAGLQDADPLVRQAAVEAVGQWGEAQELLLSSLLRMLEDANDQVKVQVIQVLPKLAGPTAAVMDGLCRCLLEDDSTWVQMNAALALGQLGGGAAAAGGALLRAAQTAEESVREQAMWALAKLQPPEMAQAFATGLKDASADIRKVASGGWIKAAAIPEEVLPALVEALRDPESVVRANAARALGRLDILPAVAITPLIDCTADSSDSVRLSATMALQRAPAAAAAETMRHLLQDPGARIRLVAAGVLLSTEPSESQAEAILKEALSDPSPQVRKAAAQLVESLGAAGAPSGSTLQQQGACSGD
jgi:HEAT repeat protein